MRIAIVSEFYYPHIGGVCEHVHHFAREARRRGHHVEIITSHLPGERPDPSVIRIARSVAINVNGGVGRFSVGWNVRAQMREALETGGYDIVHVHSPLTPALPLAALEVAAVPVVGTFHTFFHRSYAYAVLRRFFQERLDRLAAAIAVSRAVTRVFDRYFEARWTIIPNGVDLDTFRPDVPPPAIRMDVPSILFLHRLEDRNGLETLIAAFRRLRERGHRAQLVIVGDGPARRRIERLARDRSDVVFTGPAIQGRPSYYAHSAVYACPTTIASFGITLLEAMACGTPIVCSDIPGFREVVADGREAIMVPAGDDRVLAGALVTILNDSALAARLAAAGRSRAQAFGWPAVTDRVFAVYDRVLGNSGSRASSASAS